MMTKSERLLRSILGPVRADVRPLAYAVDIAGELLFERHIPMDDIRVTKDVYPWVAEQINRSPGAVTRRVERLANLCWDTLMERNLVAAYIGTPLKDIKAPRDLILYLAFYIEFERPFFDVVNQEPALLF